MEKNTKEKDNYIVPFKGAKLSRKEASKVGITLIFSYIGAIVIYFAFGIENKTAVFLICVALIALGYFGLANKIIQK